MTSSGTSSAGSRSGRGRSPAKIQNEAFVGTPELTIELMVEEDDVVVAFGAGRGTLRAGGDLEFVFSDAFTSKATGSGGSTPTR